RSALGCSRGPLAVLVHLLELRVDHTLLAGAAAIAAPGGVAALVAAALRPVHGLAQLHRGLGQGVGLGLDRLRIVALEDALEVTHRLLDAAALLGGDLVAILL